MIVEPDVTHRRTEKGLHGKVDRRATVNVPNVAEVPAVAEGGPAILVYANRVAFASGTGRRLDPVLHYHTSLIAGQPL